MWRHLRAFARLSPADRRAVMRAVVALLAARRHPRLQAKASRSGEVRMDSARAARLACLLDKTAALLPLRSSCLHRAVALSSILEAEGIDCELRIGTRRRGTDFEAHAWVEHDGMRLLPAGDEDFVPIDAPLTVRKNR